MAYVRKNKATPFLRQNTHLIEPFVKDLPQKKLLGWPEDWNNYWRPLFSNENLLSLMDDIRSSAGYSATTDYRFQIVQFIKEFHNEKY